MYGRTSRTIDSVFVHLTNKNDKLLTINDVLLYSIPSPLCSMKGRGALGDLPHVQHDACHETIKKWWHHPLRLTLCAMLGSMASMVISSIFTASGFDSANVSSAGFAFSMQMSRRIPSIGRLTYKVSTLGGKQSKVLMSVVQWSLLAFNALENDFISWAGSQISRQLRLLHSARADVTLHNKSHVKLISAGILREFWGCISIAWQTTCF